MIQGFLVGTADFILLTRCKKYGYDLWNNTQVAQRKENEYIFALQKLNAEHQNSQQFLWFYTGKCIVLYESIIRNTLQAILIGF